MRLLYPRQIDIAVALMTFAFPALVASSDQRPPNIVLIVADDYGYNDIGYHGNLIKTPVLDKLAAEGVKLENYYVQPICTPSRSQLMSGRYQIYTGLQHMVLKAEQANGLPTNFVTLPEKLREAGYSTHMIGKWHLGFYTKDHLPTSRGFDTFYGYYQGLEDYFNHTSCALVGTPCGLDLRRGTEPVWNATGQYSAHMFAAEAEQIIQERRDSEKPMFLYVALQSVHSPMEVPEKYTEQYKHLSGINRVPYAGMVAAMDEAVGNITRALDASKMAENTVFIFTTDNGGAIRYGGNNWPLKGQKATLWEGGVRGVGFVTSPLLQKTGIVNKEFMHISDWYPTLVNLGQGSMEGVTVDGFNQWPSIVPGVPSPRKELLHNIDPLWVKRGEDKYGNSTFPTSMRAALRVGDMKLITGQPGMSAHIPPFLDSETVIAMMAKEESKLDAIPFKNVWLYNITADPYELHDLSHCRETTVKSMLDVLEKYRKEAVPCRFPPADPRADPKYNGGVWGPWM